MTFRPIAASSAAERVDVASAKPLAESTNLANASTTFWTLVAVSESSLSRCAINELTTAILDESTPTIPRLP